MNSIGSHRRSAIVISVILVILFLLSRCLNKSPTGPAVVIKNSYGEQFAGTDACKSCHKDIYKSFLQTAHHFTSQRATKELIKGSFDEGENNYAYTYYDVVKAEDTDSGFYQIAYYKKDVKEAERFDIVIGSGVKGQSYLYWKGNNLFQLPLSYFSGTNTWVNSPGYPSYRPFFNRPVTARCMECHSTYIKDIGGMPNAPKFDKTQVIYGVECESCHGPALRHVDYQVQNPDDKTGRFIINPGSLSRQQQLDQCSLCHSGMQESSKPAFTFMPGDTLSHFFKPTYVADSAALLDVHGNTYALLSASKCFLSSKTFSCNTCHNTHLVQRQEPQFFSQKCMSCHTVSKGNFCPLNAQLGSVIAQNCIDCHMPVEASKTLTVQESTNDKKPAMLRSHYISIYPKESEKVLEIIKRNKQGN
jgi:hypothetical protein